MMGPSKGEIRTEPDGSKWAIGFSNPNTYVEDEVEALARRLWERCVVAGSADWDAESSIKTADDIVLAWRERFITTSDESLAQVSGRERRKGKE